MTNKIKDIKVVAFDLDGTLIDSIKDLTIAANAIRDYLKLPRIEEKVLRSYVGDGINALVNRTITNSKEKIANQEVWEKSYKHFCEYYYEHISDNTYIYKNVVETLELLQTLKIPLVIITNKHDLFARKVLKELSIINYFSIIIGGNTLEEKKPSALPLNHVCSLFNIEPKNLLMVGDSKNDILAAKNTKCFSILVNYGYGNVLELNANQNTKADITINNFMEIYDIVKNANSKE